MTTTDRAAYIAHDEKLAELHGELGAALAKREWAANAIDRAKADERRWGGKNPGHYAAEVDRAIAKHEATKPAVAAVDAAIAAHEAGYTGWNRFFLVTNVGGHIHRTLHCTTCYPTTRYAFLTDLSGKEYADAVAEEGEVLCTICFPDAPVAWTNGTRNVVKAEREARAAAKAERAAAKLAKALLPDGTGVRVGRGYGTSTEVITTIAAAKAYLTDDFADIIFYDDRTPRPDRNRVAELLADRTEDTVDGVLNAAAERAVKRVAKDMREAARDRRFDHYYTTDEAKAENAARLARVEARLAEMKAGLR